MIIYTENRGHLELHRMVVWFTTTCTCIQIMCNQCLSPLRLLVRISIRTRCTTLCDKVCQWLVTGLWFSPGTPVSSTNKTDLHDITEILLKVALNNIKTNKQIKWCMVSILQVPPLSSKVMQQYGSNKFSKFGHFQSYVVFLFCFSSSCVPCVASFSGRSILLPLRYSLTFISYFPIFIFL